MKLLTKTMARTATLVAALACLLAPRAAAQMGSIRGQVLDVAGKPWPNIGIQAVSEQGAKTEGKTDDGGNFVIRNLRAGVYSVFIQLPAPNKPYEVQCRVQSGEEAKVDVNFKDVVAKQGAAAQEEVKKQEEAKTKFEGLKAHFNAGNTLLDQEKVARTELQKASPDQRNAAKQ